MKIKDRGASIEVRVSQSTKRADMDPSLRAYHAERKQEQEARTLGSLPDVTQFEKDVPRELAAAFKNFNILLKGDDEDIRRVYDRLQEDIKTFNETGEFPAGYQARLKDLQTYADQYAVHLKELHSITEKRSLFYVNDEVATGLNTILDRAYTKAAELGRLVLDLPNSVEKMELKKTVQISHEQLTEMLHTELEDVKRRAKLIDQNGNRLATPEDVKETQWQDEKREAEFRLAVVEPQLEEAWLNNQGGPNRLATFQDLISAQKILHKEEKPQSPYLTLYELKRHIENDIKLANQEIARAQEDRKVRKFLEELHPEKKIADAKVLQAKLKKDPGFLDQTIQELRRVYDSIQNPMQEEVDKLEQFLKEEIENDEIMKRLKTERTELGSFSRKADKKTQEEWLDKTRANVAAQNARQSNIKKLPEFRNLQRLQRMIHLLSTDRDDLTFAEIGLHYDETLPMVANLSGKAGVVEVGQETAVADTEHDLALRQLMETDPHAAKSAALPWKRRSDSGQNKKVTSDKKRIPVEEVSNDAAEAVRRQIQTIPPDQNFEPTSMRSDTTPTKLFDPHMMRTLLEEQDKPN